MALHIRQSLGHVSCLGHLKVISECMEAGFPQPQSSPRGAASQGIPSGRFGGPCTAEVPHAGLTWIPQAWAGYRPCCGWGHPAELNPGPIYCTAPCPHLCPSVLMGGGRNWGPHLPWGQTTPRPRIQAGGGGLGRSKLASAQLGMPARLRGAG